MIPPGKQERCADKKDMMRTESGNDTKVVNDGSNDDFTGVQDANWSRCAKLI